MYSERLQESRLIPRQESKRARERVKTLAASQSESSFAQFYFGTLIPPLNTCTISVSLRLRFRERRTLRIDIKRRIRNVGKDNLSREKIETFIFVVATQFNKGKINRLSNGPKKIFSVGGRRGGGRILIAPKRNGFTRVFVVSRDTSRCRRP